MTPFLSEESNNLYILNYCTVRVVLTLNQIALYKLIMFKINFLFKVIKHC